MDAFVVSTFAAARSRPRRDGVGNTSAQVTQPRLQGVPLNNCAGGGHYQDFFPNLDLLMLYFRSGELG